MDKCTIDRSKWVRGDNELLFGETRLLNDEGNMCCLGFYSRQVLKRKKDDLLSEDFPFAIWNGESAHDGTYHVIQGIYEELADINDYNGITEKQREYRIKEVFKEVLNCKLTFVGRTPRGIRRGIRRGRSGR